MVEGGAGPEFPVVFFDGEREMNIGSIRIYPLLEFKAFQLMLSQRIGISPNQISIYLADEKSSKFEDRRRIPITGKANFGLISREKDCFILVVLKRSRKSKNKKTVVKTGYAGGFSPENLILLRRTNPEINHLGFGSGFRSLPFYDYYSCSNLMHLNDPYPDPKTYTNADPFLLMMKSKCEQCKGKNGYEKDSGFHHCTNDPVIVCGYRSRFGPVGGRVYFD
ncbi:unnamed protein product [Withania somnifera]